MAKGILKFHKKIYAKTIVSFVLTCALCAVIVAFSVFNRTYVEVLTMEQLIAEKSAKVNEVLSRLLYKTQALAALVIQSNGEIKDFEQTAATIVDDPSIMNVIIAPGGVVTHVYPLSGNEAVLNLDYFSEGAGNREAIQARETGSLVLGGPFTSVQGGEILVGRLPVYTDAAGGRKEFWGLVSVTLKYPQALEGCGLSELQIQGFAYEIWRINPDDGQMQIIADSGYKYNNNVRYIEKHLSIHNAEWYFRILPVRTWYEYPDSWLLIFLGLCISFLVASVVQNNNELKELKAKFESLSNTDYLTGIHNRRYMEEEFKSIIRKLTRSGGALSVMMIDVDFFKKYNDTYGHNTGDECLKTITKVLLESVSGIDNLVARYGGEEFVVILPNTSTESACVIAETLLKNVQACGIPHETSSVANHVTISIGVASGTIERTQKIDDYIGNADKALYLSKQNGRNRYTLSVI